MPCPSSYGYRRLKCYDFLYCCGWLPGSSLTLSCSLSLPFFSPSPSASHNDRGGLVRWLAAPGAAAFCPSSREEAENSLSAGSRWGLGASIFTGRGILFQKAEAASVSKRQEQAGNRNHKPGVALPPTKAISRYRPTEAAAASAAAPGGERASRPSGAFVTRYPEDATRADSGTGGSVGFLSLFPLN